MRISYTNRDGMSLVMAAIWFRGTLNGSINSYSNTGKGVAYY